MAWFSLAYAAVCLFYLSISTTVLEQYFLPLAIIACLYLTLFAAFAFSAKNTRLSHTLSFAMILSLTIINIVVTFAVMMGDSGLNSNSFLLFFIILYSSAYWFGASVLLFTLIFIILGYFINMMIFGVEDYSLFAVHVLALIAGPVMAILLSHSSQPKFILRNKLIALLNQSPLPIFTFYIEDGIARIHFANTLTQQTFSNDSSPLTNIDIRKLAIPEDEEVLASFCRQALYKTRKNKTSPFFVRGKNHQHQMLQLLCVADRLYWEGEYIGICFFFDISQSENKRNEMQASMKEGYMSTLVAGIVHDFRNVLTTIIGTAEILQFSAIDKETHDQLERIIDSGARGSDTITHLLELSSTKKASKKTLPDDMRKALNSIIELLRIQLPDNIKLHANIEKKLPPVYLDTTELEQLLMNLVNNATQAIKKRGEISIIVAPYSNTELQPMLKISVLDNGCGIPEEDLPFVTDNFWTSRKEKGGTGLGLAMVKRIVNSHDGKLEISSTLNTGTSIDIYLPEDIKEDNHTNTSPKQAKLSVSPEIMMKPCTILLVDDNPEVLEIHRILLESMGHITFPATSGYEALSIHEKEKNNIQLLITDLRMPGMDGVELAERLRTERLRKEAPKIPVLIVTAYGNKKNFNRITNTHISVLLKPGNFQKLGEAVAKIQLENPEIFS